MKTIVNTFDLFSRNVTLYTNSSTKITTNIGFFLTIISVILFSVIFYCESYEVFKREHPTVISYKQNLNKNNSTLTLNNNTFNFFINLDINFNPEKLFKNFYIESHLGFEDVNSESYLEVINYEICNEKDKVYFSNLINGFNFPEGVNLCPRINFADYKDISSFNNFFISFEIQECPTSMPDCIKDIDFYEKIWNGEYNMRAVLSFVDSQMVFNNPYHPYMLKLSNHNSDPFFTMSIKLEGSEIHTQSLFSSSLNIEGHSQFNVLKSKRRENEDKSKFISYTLTFESKDMYMYYRSYKTLNYAFANSFALFKLITWIIAVILSPYYTYYKNTNIINKNFNYEESFTAYKRSMQNINSKNDITTELTVIKKQPKLTIGLVIKNVSCFRYILCRRSNSSKDFYNKAKFVISKYLSIEKLFLHLVEYYRLKEYLLNQNDIIKFNSMRRKLILCNKLKNEELKLRLVINDSDNNFNNIEKP
jgi:hypothetical protein